MLIWPISLNSKEIFKCWYCIMRHLSIGCWAYLNNFCRAYILWVGYVWNNKTDWKPRITNSLAKCLIQASLLGPSKKRGDIQTFFFPCSTTYHIPPLFLRFPTLLPIIHTQFVIASFLSLLLGRFSVLMQIRNEWVSISTLVCGPVEVVMTHITIFPLGDS